MRFRINTLMKAVAAAAIASVAGVHARDMLESGNEYAGTALIFEGASALMMALIVLAAWNGVGFPGPQIGPDRPAEPGPPLPDRETTRTGPP